MLDNLPLQERLEKLKAFVKGVDYKYTDFEDCTLAEEGIAAAVCWGKKGGADTQKVLLAVVPEDYLDDQAAEKVLSLSFQVGEWETIAAVVEDGKGNRFFDLDPGAPYEMDILPPAVLIDEIGRFRKEPTYRWSNWIYHKLQHGFDNFHEQVYSSVRDTVDGKNDIIDETAKFVFLELFRLTHQSPGDKLFEFKGQKFSLDEVFQPEPFEQDTKAQKQTAVERVRAAFDTFKKHKDYVIKDGEGNQYPIFSDRDYLKLSVPENYAALIRLLQDLGYVTDNSSPPPIKKKLDDNNIILYRDPITGEPVKGTLTHISGDVLGRSFDVFLRHKFQKEGVGIYLTPYPVKRAMVDMLIHDLNSEGLSNLVEREADGRPAFRVCDPSGGTGGFLTTLIPQLRRVLEQANLGDEERESLWRDIKEHSFYAADSSPRMVRLARLNMALHDAPRAHIYNLTDSLTTSELKPNYFDVILTNPPFGTPKTAQKEEKERLEKYRSDIDWEAVSGKDKGILRPTTAGLAMGAAPDSKGFWKPKDKGVDLSVLFVDRCLQLLKPGGRLLMIVPDSILCNANTHYLREYLMGQKDEKTGEFHGGKAIVKAVVSLPADAFKLSGTGAKTSILYVQKRKADPKNPNLFIDEPQRDVFMAVADTLGYSVKQNQEVADVPNDLVPIVGAYRRGN